MNKFFFSLYRRNNCISHNIIKKVQQKYSFQGVLNQDENSRKFQGVGGRDKQPLEKEIPEGSGSKVKVPSVKGGGGGGGPEEWTVSGTTQYK